MVPCSRFNCLLASVRHRHDQLPLRHAIGGHPVRAVSPVPIVHPVEWQKTQCRCGWRFVVAINCQLHIILRTHGETKTIHRLNIGIGSAFFSFHFFCVFFVRSENTTYIGITEVSWCFLEPFRELSRFFLCFFNLKNPKDSELFR